MYCWLKHGSTRRVPQPGLRVKSTVTHAAHAGQPWRLTEGWHSFSNGRIRDLRALLPGEDMEESTPPGSRHRLGLTCVGATTLLMLYCWTYLLLVHREMMKISMSASRSQITCAPRYSSHPAADAWLRTVFEPLALLDQQVRPSYWDYSEGRKPLPRSLFR